MFARPPLRRTLKTPVLGITGNLPRDEVSYVQVLEGGREAVNNALQSHRTRWRRAPVILLKYSEKPQMELMATAQIVRRAG